MKGTTSKSGGFGVAPPLGPKKYSSYINLKRVELNLSQCHFKRKPKSWRSVSRWSNEWWNLKRKRGPWKWPIALTVRACGGVRRHRRQSRATRTWSWIIIEKSSLTCHRPLLYIEMKHLRCPHKKHLKGSLSKQPHWWMQAKRTNSKHLIIHNLRKHSFRVRPQSLKVELRPTKLTLIVNLNSLRKCQTIWWRLSRTKTKLSRLRSVK